jgi:hypothetical protein
MFLLVNRMMKCLFTLLLSFISLAAGASELAEPPRSLPDYSWLSVATQNVVIPAAKYKKGALDKAMKDMSGLFKVFKPQPQNDPSLRVASTRYDKNTGILNVELLKRVLGAWISSTRKLQVSVENFSGCSIGTGYNLRLNTGESDKLREIHVHICASEISDGSLALASEVALVVGKNYEQWVFWSAEDFYRTLPDALVIHIRNKSSEVPRAMSYSNMLHEIDVKSPRNLLPETPLVHEYEEPSNDDEDAFTAF